jgi:hypothetical protein
MIYSRIWRIQAGQKANGRPGFHESTILLLRQGMAAGTPLPVFSAPRCLPCLALFQARPWKTADKQAKSKNNVSQDSSAVKAWMKKIPLNSLITH